MKSPELASTGVLPASPINLAAKPLRLPLALCVLFLISGSSGLIYEVVWLRILSRTLGSTVYATSTILAVFMGGLALGSFLFGRFADRVRRPLVLYAILEAGIGATALLSLGLNSWPAPLYRAIYALGGGSRAALTLGQIIIAVAALLIPTSLMGATLPTLCAYGVRRCAAMGRVVGTLYALNTLGAMAGAMVSGFILIGAIGETRTVLVGAAINALVALVALVLLPTGAADAPPVVPPPAASAAAGHDDAVARRVRRTVLVCFSVSGFVSLALEIVWSRMLTLYLGTSVYSFTAMLAVMLAGIAIGGWYGGRVERWKDPLGVLARLELGVGLCAAAGLALFAPLDHHNHGYLLPPLIMVGPAALLLGIAFPVTVRCYTDHARAIGRRVGELYAWNTVGCILGSLCGGFLLLPLMGAAHSGTLLAVVAALSGVALLAVHPRGIRAARPADVALVLATIAIAAITGDPFRDVIFNRLYAMSKDIKIFAHVEEATAATTAAGVPERPKARSLLVNGVGMTVPLTGNKLMAHLPLWMVDSPKNALVICLGMGTTFRSAVSHHDVDVTVVELVPAVTRFMGFYHPDAAEVMAQPNAHVVVDDGRNYLLMHERLFDVITIDPAPPIHSAGTVNLYSREFFELCARRIQPGGAVCLWMPPAPMSDSSMILRTFASVFPHISVWAGPTYPGLYLIGTLKPVRDIEGRIRRGFADPAIVADMREWDKDCDTAEKTLSLRFCDRAGLMRFTGGSPLVTDDHPYTEFPMWRMNGRDPEYSRQLNSDYLRKWLAEH